MGRISRFFWLACFIWATLLSLVLLELLVTSFLEVLVTLYFQSKVQGAPLPARVEKKTFVSRLSTRHIPGRYSMRWGQVDYETYEIYLDDTGQYECYWKDTSRTDGNIVTCWKGIWSLEGRELIIKEATVPSVLARPDVHSSWMIWRAKLKPEKTGHYDIDFLKGSLTEVYRNEETRYEVDPSAQGLPSQFQLRRLPDEDYDYDEED